MRDQKQLENVEYFNYWGGLIASDARCTHEIKSRIVMEKAAFNKKETLVDQQLDSNLSTRLTKGYIWSITLYDAKTWSENRSELP